MVQITIIDFFVVLSSSPPEKCAFYSLCDILLWICSAQPQSAHQPCSRTGHPAWGVYHMMEITEGSLVKNRLNPTHHLCILSLDMKAILHRGKITRFSFYKCPNIHRMLEINSWKENIFALQVLKLLAEMSPYCGDMDKLEVNLNMLFEKLLVKAYIKLLNSRRNFESFSLQPLCHPTHPLILCFCSLSLSPNAFRSSCPCHQRRRMERMLQMKSPNYNSATWSVCSLASTNWAKSYLTSSSTKSVQRSWRTSRSGQISHYSAERQRMCCYWKHLKSWNICIITRIITIWRKIISTMFHDSQYQFRRQCFLKICTHNTAQRN